MAPTPNIARTILAETAGLAAKTALADGSRTLSYGGLADAVSRAARALADCGVRPLDRVALQCPDSADHIVLSLAILSIEAVVVPVAPELMSDERATLPAQMDVRFVLTDAAHAPDGEGEPFDAPDVLDRPFRLTRRTPSDTPREGYDAIHPAFIRFSSGTTGTSKGVVLSHQTILDRTDAANAGLGVTSSDVVAWVLSMSFHFVVTILLFLRKGATIVLCGAPLPDALVDALRRYPVTLLYASPIHYRLLTLAETLTRENFAAVRLAVSTAVHLPAQVAGDVRERFGLRISEAYGIIEVGLPFVRLTQAGDPPGLLGRPLPGYEARLAEDGEILLRGQGLYDAYFAPWQPRAACQPDGWFRTGDLGEWTANGELRLIGHRKTVINFSGMKVFPQEVEDALNRHPAVAESLVYGEPHPEYGQLPCARLVLKDPSSPLDEADLRAFCRARLALYKIPKTFTCVPALPKTASGKLRRT